MFVQIKIMLYFSIILMYNERERIFSFIHRKKGAIMSERQNAVEIYLDESLRRFETVFPACGSSNSAIEVTLSELEKFSGSDRWIDVCRLKEENPV